MFKTVAKRSPRMSVAYRSLKGGRRKAHTSPWSQNGCTLVGHWSPRKKCALLWTLCINLSNASAFLVRPLCLPWPTNSVRWAINVATTVPPFGDHCLHSAFLCDLLCHYSSLGRSRKAQGSCCSSYTETELSGFGRPLSVLTIFLVAQRWHEGRSPTVAGKTSLTTPAHGQPPILRIWQEVHWYEMAVVFVITVALWSYTLGMIKRCDWVLFFYWLLTCAFHSFDI